jgi:two-component system, OmpR family, sensor kinase
VRVADDAVLDARALDGSRSISLSALEHLVVTGDESRLRQVCANLLSNALAHTPPGTAIRVRVVREDGDAVLEVQDDGSGIDPEDAHHVFEPFYRADPSRGRAAATAGQDGSGTGLGLAIVAAVAEAHAGVASVRSAPGEGATFTIRFPLSGGADDEVMSPVSDTGDPHAEPVSAPERPDAPTGV